VIVQPVLFVFVCYNIEGDESERRCVGVLNFLAAYSVRVCVKKYYLLSWRRGLACGQ